MFVVDGIVVSSELFEQRFVCNLSKCKGACCWEGDFGAPLQEDEIALMQSTVHKLLPLLQQESQDIIIDMGVSHWDPHYKGNVTPLTSSGACVFLTMDHMGIAKCGWEKIYEEGATDFRKPISCHLYPVRVEKNEDTTWHALNYDRWDICSAACTLGDELQVPVFRFLKEAIIRAYGDEFYKQLESIYETYFTPRNKNLGIYGA